jgi:hypothetical protein
MPQRGDKQQGRTGERSTGGSGALVTVPVEMIYELRKSPHIELSGAAQDIDAVAIRMGQVIHPEWYEEPLGRFDAIRALLDEIGWWNTDPPAEVRFDLDPHRLAVTRALEAVLLFAEADMNELDAVEAERAKRGEPSTREDTTRRVLALREFAAAIKDLVGRIEIEEGRRDE